jgi:hypothetical protein
MPKPTVVLDSFRVIQHPPLCPECQSDNITTEDVEIADGATETAYICRSCGEAWPVACVTDWTLTRQGGR